MHAPVSPLITALVAIHIFCLQVTAAECPAVTQPDTLYPDDEACLDKLDSRFLEFSPEIEFLSERNSLLSAHVYADQRLIIETFYVKYCNLLGEPRWQLSAEEQDLKLAVAKEKLYTRVPFPPPVVDTRNVVFASPAHETYVAGNVAVSGIHPMLMNGGGYLLLAMDQHETTASKKNYLREVPFLVTKGNKYFVIVSSVRSQEGAFEEVSRLKARAPQFDFVAYAPYGRNTYYGIMMATWVPLSVAQEALADAREYVSSDSYIWACPSEGDRC